MRLSNAARCNYFPRWSGALLWMCWRRDCGQMACFSVIATTGDGSPRLSQYTKSSSFFGIEAGLLAGMSRQIVLGAWLGWRCRLVSRSLLCCPSDHRARYFQLDEGVSGANRCCNILSTSVAA